LYLYLLATNINVDVDKLSFEHLLIIIISFLAVVAIVFLAGLSLKFGEKEINIGGVQRLLARRDKDVLLKEHLKKITDDIDHEVTANLFDLVEELEDHLEPPLILGSHCYFTYEKFSSIVKGELYKRIRRNSLWEKLSDAGKNKYVAAILRDIEQRYALLQSKTNQVKCGDTYAEFTEIKMAIRKVLGDFFDNTTEILIAGKKKKIEIYEKYKAEFQTAKARKLCCDDCIQKNESRIKKLTAVEVKYENNR